MSGVSWSLDVLVIKELKPSQMDEELIKNLLNLPYMCPPHNVSCSTMARCMLNVEFLLYKLWPGFHIILNGGKKPITKMG